MSIRADIDLIQRKLLAKQGSGVTDVVVTAVSWEPLPEDVEPCHEHERCHQRSQNGIRTHLLELSWAVDL